MSLPHSMTIIGAGVIGCEYASIFSHIGTRVTIIDSRKELMSFLDSEVRGCSFIFDGENTVLTIVLG